jgi:KilA-N domain
MSTKIDYVNIANGIDNRISILKHCESGYYNVSQSLKAINKVGENSPTPTKKGTLESQGTSRSGGTPKTWSKWFETDTAKALIAACNTELGVNDRESYFSICNGPNKFRGTYVHRFLYDHILSWASPEYAMRVSRILNEYHDRIRARLEQEIAEKADKIDELKTMMEEQSKIANQHAAEQRAQIAELLGYAKDTTKKLDEVKDELIETKEEVILSKTYLEEKSLHSTMNPSNGNLHHAVAATKYDNKNEKCVKVITGQRKYVDKTVQKNLDNGHTLAIDTFYNANGIDLRQNTCDAFKRKRKEVVIAYNAERVAEAKAFNYTLRKEINLYNKKNPDTQRIYVKEKMVPKKISIGDITVKFSKLAFSYTENPYMSFDEVLQIIIDTNQATQVSPLASSDSE